MNISKFINLTKDIKIVSFDIFDTLIERKCLSPRRIFNLAARIGGVVDCNVASFCCDRILAENEARKKHKEKTQIGDIYSELRKIGYDVDYSCEIEAETLMCKPKDSVLPLFEWACKNKVAVLTSDMYLGSSYIKQIIDGCGISGYDRMYVSCEHGAEKVSGKLFGLISKDYNIKPSKILHIGDSLKADILGGWKAGVRTIYIPKTELLSRIFNHYNR